NDETICAITAAMRDGTGLHDFSEQYPVRFFDVGIAEGHAVAMAAGMAKQGLTPVVAIYSSFLQRAYDQLIHDTALSDLHVVFAVDRAGMVGADGETHHGIFDATFLSEIPNMTVLCPSNFAELRTMLDRAVNEIKGPVAIRYPRGKCEHTDWQSEMQEISIGKGRMLKNGNDIAVLSLGPIGNDAARAIDAAEKDGISAAHYDMVFLKPLDEELVKDVATKFKHIITVEDGCITGGLGTAVMECVNKNGLQSIVHRVGIPDRFVKQGTVAQLYKQCGMDSESIKELIISLAGDSKK
ncbi:MAG: 1-deoxy-D-xylulose-5-phosphate synthase, partial [Porphyromonadaceae bacterium]|nr:1-deoxy-D-xylulose-5-phosphate synthase [Porphyromonadaceae bacterium]